MQTVVSGKRNLIELLQVRLLHEFYNAPQWHTSCVSVLRARKGLLVIFTSFINILEA